MEFNVLGMKFSVGRNTPPVITEEVITETPKPSVASFDITEDNSGYDDNYGGQIVAVQESVVEKTPQDIRKILESDNVKMSSLMEAIKSDYGAEDTYKENEEMAKDTIVGSAMEMVADDCSQMNPITNHIVSIESEDLKLKDFLEKFLHDTVDVDSRIWEWALEVVKHGDFKLRRLEYKVAGQQASNVYYENVTEGFRVSRLEYLGNILGYLDGEEGVKIEKPEEFIHFISSKNQTRKKIKIKVKNADGKIGEVSCYKVGGTCIMDNARYIFRVVSLLDNMLIMSRIARSTQYNLVKIEVGNSSPAKTQQIVSEVRRKIEGNTRMTKNKGMKTDPSPIPVNSNVYIPVREGKGDVTIDSVNDSLDIKSIVDIDYFKNKEFAAIRVPKPMLGFEEALPSSMGNTSLVKLDIRYARMVKRVQGILKAGIEDLCNNYLRFRGRVNDIGKFKVVLKSATSAEDSDAITDFQTKLTIFDGLTTLLSEFDTYLDRGKLLAYLFNIAGISAGSVGSDAFCKTVEKIEKNEKPTPSKTPPAQGEGDMGAGEGETGAEGESDTGAGAGVEEPDGVVTGTKAKFVK